jgi:hypothetical protein
MLDLAVLFQSFEIFNLNYSKQLISYVNVPNCMAEAKSKLKQSQNVDIFKRRLKMWLFNDHFGWVAL